MNPAQTAQILPYVKFTAQASIILITANVFSLVLVTLISASLQLLALLGHAHLFVVRTVVLPAMDTGIVFLPVDHRKHVLVEYVLALAVRQFVEPSVAPDLAMPQALPVILVTAALPGEFLVAKGLVAAWIQCAVFWTAALARIAKHALMVNVFASQIVMLIPNAVILMGVAVLA